MDLDLELKAFMQAMKKNGCPMWMFERDEDGNFEDMTMAHSWYAWQEKAKAQAVPEGYVFLKTESARNCVEYLSIAACHPNNSADDENSIYALMEEIEQASESGAEG
ncbi:hypothetical protein F937_01757 [Acinetobacter calcoaceticus ANC 3680]|uniref:hypothetical protein n=1 Tax=Acinetobacter calcoaceticus TaxID=471 RepID=UPI0002CE8423|nr:hypothetical protein [Acinetobacter calcoaceticus]ENV92363.1 hypothetical protein F937_01757 [Acinetobacter calcoaceticus ANC 3680]